MKSLGFNPCLKCLIIKGMLEYKNYIFRHLPEVWRLFAVNGNLRRYNTIRLHELKSYGGDRLKS